ncbi:hypothetical protein CPB84DRAFT_1852363 [Gymnopilus junonius]|uniref:Ricin B lectin domain-containing protein n=1 Tax=Gymnopilus junonius TaxID=109634 RepID=A0A9P5ND53_GYMJU|nr:hypothetical protein CPB84DRAFT_1852363 [Gymnopilus junonius]
MSGSNNNNKLFRDIKIIHSVAYSDQVVDLDAIGLTKVQGYHLGHEDPAKGNNNQHWRVDPILPSQDSNLFTLYNVRGNSYAGFEGDANNGKAIQDSLTPTVFEITPKSQGASQYIIKVPHTSSALVLDNGNNGTEIKLAGLNHNDAKQQWTFEDL